LSEREIVCADLNGAIDDLRREGFRLDVIYPADDPKAALLSRAGEAVRVALPDAPSLPAGPAIFTPEFVLTKAGEHPAQGRAGMLYRDLIPGRLGGRYIASHITIPGGGPVADWVHYHRVSLQLIFVRRGWVRVVYQDQGAPFVMNEGDLVLQPPGIRHRVLESAPGLEVIEVSAPALHETFADHELPLPNGERPGLAYGGQRFLRHIAANTPWTDFHGAQAQHAQLWDATGGIAEARLIRPGIAAEIAFSPQQGELVFGFVLDGTASLNDCELRPADAFVVPPDEPWSLKAMSPDFRLLHVATARLDAAA
jgi:quercetin dioxygenase-like cupin family protein